MNMKSVKILAIIASASLLVTSCKKFGDTNINPNGTSTPSTAALLSNVESGLGAFASATRDALYAQQISETQYTEVSLYALPKLDFDGTYSGALYDLQNIIIYNSDPEKIPLASKFGSANNQIAIARILKAYIFWTLTDRWGDIPYTEALKGAEDLTPAYDTQEFIYKDLIKELTQAADQFDAGAAPTGDFLFKGSSAAWKRIANSLRMLITLRTSKVYPNPGEWAATEFNKAFTDSDGFADDSVEGLILAYPGNVAAFRNPWYNLYNGRTDFAESELMTNFMAAYNDPRQAAFGSSTVGFPYGLTRDQAVAFTNDHDNYAKVLASGFRATSSALPVISASSVNLAIAEAAQRGWITADVAAYYKKGITESWKQWNIKADGVDAYIAQANVSLATNPLEKIQLQQYFAFYPNGLQAWSNWRRTNVPALVPTPNAGNSGGKIPRRYVYGSSAYAAGLDINDVLLKADGSDIKTAKDFEAVTEKHKPGETIEIVYSRKGVERTTKLTFIENPSLEVLPIENTGGTLTTEMKAFRDKWLESAVK
ncbi:MAG: SusD/RagB family nutrient-binding outer membrane lipoprotein [Chitinophagaceae bacterium]|nr:MAG: SusD/RagB family nutrient-binding outer membrane lipoprotein [Chitinophagaceae bacterium]